MEVVNVHHVGFRDEKDEFITRYVVAEDVLSGKRQRAC